MLLNSIVSVLVAGLFQSNFPDTHEFRCGVMESAVLLASGTVDTDMLQQIEDGEGQAVGRDGEPVRLEYQGQSTIFTLRFRSEANPDEVAGGPYFDLYADGEEAPVRSFPHPANVHQSIRQAGPAVIWCRRQGFDRAPEQ